MKKRTIAVLAALAIVSALVAFLFPAAQAARPSAFRQQCHNNLKQIGLGLLNYCQSNNSLPPGTVANGTLPLEERLSWLLSTMPYMLCMHCCGMNTDIAWAQSWSSAKNRSLGVTPVFLLNCPGSHAASSEEQSAVNYVDISPKRNLHPSPYIGLAGVGRDAPTLPKHSPRAGVFGYDRMIRLDDIKDGAGTTMMVAETGAAEGAWTAGGFATVRGIDQSRKPYIGRGRQFGGNHAGGVEILFADGSVRFVRESTDTKVFEALSTIAGGERVSEAWDKR